MRQSLFLSALLFLMLTAGTYAQESKEVERPTPLLAIDACAKKSDGNACEFTAGGEKKVGKCMHSPDRHYFACIPVKEEKVDQRSQGAR